MGGGVNGTQFHQPILSGEFAGTEVRDPLFSSNRCGNTGQNCRESDAAIIEYTDPHTPQLVLGSIYKTTNRDPNNGSREIPTNNPHFYVKDVNNFILLNSENNKIGARTGWTYGLVTDICRDFTVSGTTVTTVVCQNVVQAGSDHGDSGAPVFETTADPDSVIFNGILSGGYTDRGTEYFWYSPVTAVNNELSGPNVHDLTFTAPPPPLSVFISGPSIITSGGSYTWEANADHGDGGYSYQWEYASSLGGPWNSVESSKAYTKLVTLTDQMQRFYLRVTVTSGSEQTTTTHNVTVTANDCPPNQIC